MRNHVVRSAAGSSLCQVRFRYLWRFGAGGPAAMQESRQQRRRTRHRKPATTPAHPCSAPAAVKEIHHAVREETRCQTSNAATTPTKNAMVPHTKVLGWIIMTPSFTNLSSLSTVTVGLS